MIGINDTDLPSGLLTSYVSLPEANGHELWFYGILWWCDEWVCFFDLLFPNGKPTVTGNPEGQMFMMFHIFGGPLSKSKFIGKTGDPWGNIYILLHLYISFIYYIYSKKIYIYIYIYKWENHSIIEIQYKSRCLKQQFVGYSMV